MSGRRCPYHVKQGLVDANGSLVLSDVCGVKTVQGATCTHIPFVENCYKGCSRYMAQQTGGERHVLVPKNDIEYLPEVGGLSSFSEMELM